MMWRHGSFDASDLNTDCNADDAQIASLIRINGLRSILILRHRLPICPIYS